MAAIYTSRLYIIIQHYCFDRLYLYYILTRNLLFYFPSSTLNFNYINRTALSRPSAFT
jgi:hypothetical protein